MKILIRLLFMMIPSMAWGLVFSFIDTDLGLLIFFMLFYLGYEVTKPEPSRGEKFLA